MRELQTKVANGVLLLQRCAPEAPSTVETLFSISALIVSIGSAFVTWRLSRRQTLIQERLLSVEEHRERDRLAEQASAIVRAELLSRGPGNYRLVLTNVGQGEARNVVVRINGNLPTESPYAHADTDAIPALGPTAHASILMFLDSESPASFDVAITWDDDSGVPGNWRSHVNAF